MWGPQARDRIKNTRTLIVDEVSMISGDFFTQLEQQCRKIRGREQAFGGIQVVVTGDFLQVRTHAVVQCSGEGRALTAWHTRLRHPRVWPAASCTHKEARQATAAQKR